MLGLLLWFLLECLVQVAAEILLELGLIPLRESARVHRRHHPVLAFIGFLMLGALAGFLSLFVYRRPVIPGERGRLLELLLAPIVVGLVMRLLGHWRQRRGKLPGPLESFWHAWGFALAFGLLRFLWPTRV